MEILWMYSCKIIVIKKIRNKLKKRFNKRNMMNFMKRVRMNNKFNQYFKMLMIILSLENKKKQKMNKGLM